MNKQQREAAVKASKEQARIATAEAEDAAAAAAVSGSEEAMEAAAAKQRAADAAAEAEVIATQAAADEDAMEKEVEQEDKDMVVVTVPRQFNLYDEAKVKHEIKAGTYEMQRRLAEHQYSVNQGVKIHKAGK